MAGYYLEPLENNVSFDTKLFAASLDRRALSVNDADRKEKMLEIIEIVCYSGKSKFSDVNIKQLDRSVMEEVFEELQMYCSDEAGESDTDLHNEGQTIVEINRIAGMSYHFDKYKPKFVQKSRRRFF